MKLYPRNPGASKRADIRQHAMAHRTLDRATRGEKVRPDVMDWALAATGDLAGLSRAELATVQRVAA
jgi:hypothetical protein